MAQPQNKDAKDGERVEVPDDMEEQEGNEECHGWSPFSKGFCRGLSLRWPGTSSA